MLGVGWTEMLVIGVVALIVIGPRDLPMVMQKVGRFAGMIRRMGSEFQRELNKTTGLDEVRNLRDSITAPLKQTADEIRREFNATTSSGAVKPSGAIAPKDPNAESIVDEIHEAAGMKPPAATVQPVVAEPIKGARLTPVPSSRVEALELMALAQAPAAPEKTDAPATKKPRARKATTAEAATTAKPAAKQATAKPAAKKPAAKKPAANASAVAESETPAAKAAAKPKAAKPKAEEKP